MSGAKVSILIVDVAVDFGGSIVSTANLIRGLDRSRYAPVFVSSSSEELVRNKLSEASAITPVIIAKKTLHYARLGEVSRVLGGMKPVALRRGLLLLVYLLRLLVNLPYALRLAWLIRKYDVDLVQINNGFGNDELELVCRLLRMPRVMFFRGYAPLSVVERKLFLDGVKAFVAVSEYVKTEAAADGVPADKVTVATPPAIAEILDETARAAVRARYDIGADDLLFGIFGRVVEWKGQKEFVRAAALVMQQFPRAKAIIVGDSSDGGASYLAEVKTLVEQLNIADKVVFTGYIEKVHELYSIMDVVVHASIEPEPSGRVIFEAMSHGVPVVASCYGGPKEFIEQGVDGYICDPKQPAELAGRICDLLADEARRRSMGRKAQSKVEEFHNKSSYARRIEAVYERALADESGGSR